MSQNLNQYPWEFSPHMYCTPEQHNGHIHHTYAPRHMHVKKNQPILVRVL